MEGCSACAAGGGGGGAVACQYVMFLDGFSCYLAQSMLARITRASTGPAGDAAKRGSRLSAGGEAMSGATPRGSSPAQPAPEDSRWSVACPAGQRSPGGPSRASPARQTCCVC